MSDKYRAAAKAWAKADGEARELEAMKDAKLHSMALDMCDPEMSVAAAERTVKASQEWAAHIIGMVAARTKANDLRADMDALIMEHEAAHRPSQVRAA